MNYLRITLIVLSLGILSGCSKGDKYDVAESQVKKKGSQMQIDLKDASDKSAKIELGDSDVKIENGQMTIPKGSKLPDGSTAKEDTKFKVETDNVGPNAHWGKTSVPSKK